MSFRNRAGGDRGLSLSTRSHPPPIITTARSQPSTSTSSSSSRVSTSVSHSDSSTSTLSALPTPLSPHHLGPPHPQSSPGAPPSPLSSSSLPVLHSGWLKKKSQSSFSSDRRFFSLSSHFLSYFRSSTDRFPLAYINLTEVASVAQSGCTVELGLTATGSASSAGDKKYRLVADSRQDGELWRRLIEKAVAALRREEMQQRRRGAAADEDLSPRTPMALKRSAPSSLGSQWAEEPSELERAFFALKFGGSRGGSWSRLLLDVRTDLDILRFALELMLDAAELRQGRATAINAVYVPERRRTVTGAGGERSLAGMGGGILAVRQAFPLPAAITAAAASSLGSLPAAAAGVVHHRAASALATGELCEYRQEDAIKPVSSPTSPQAEHRAIHPAPPPPPPPAAAAPPVTRQLRATSVTAATAFSDKVRQMREKLASYAVMVASLAYDDRQYLLSWLLSASTLSALTGLLCLPNALLHDRLLRVLFLHCQLSVRREKRLKLVGGDEGWLSDAVGERFAGLLMRHMGQVTLPALQLQVCTSLLLMLSTPLACFPHPVFPAAIAVPSSTPILHPCLLRGLFACLFRSDFHLRKKVLKLLTQLLEGGGNTAVLARERDVSRWLLLLCCDVPLSSRRKAGVLRKVLDYALSLLCRLHALAFTGREETPAVAAASQKEPNYSPEKQQQAAGAGRSAAATVSFKTPLPLFPELLNRSLHLAAVSSPRQYHGTVRSLLLQLCSHLYQHTELFQVSQPPSGPSSQSSTPRASSAAQAASKQMDATCFSSLLHLLLLVKTFLFVPSRFTDIVSARQPGVASSVPAAGRPRSATDSERMKRGSVEVSLPVAAASSSSYIADLLPSDAVSSGLQQSSDGYNPHILDLAVLLHTPLPPLSHEQHEAAAAAAAASSSSSSAPLSSVDPLQDFSSFLSGVSVSEYDVHRLEKRGLKGDAELLMHVTRLLSALTADSWLNLPAAGLKGGVRVSERLAAELGFFQDAYVFTLLLSPMVTAAAGGAVPDLTSPLAASGAASDSAPAFSSSLLTSAETSELIGHFLLAKAGHRRKVFRRFELRYRDRQLQESREAEVRSRAIEQQMEEDAERERQVVKVLLLGPSEAGKSTLFKQVRRVYGGGFELQERQGHAVIILANLLRAMRALVFHSDRLLLRFPFSALSNLTGSSTTAIAPALSDSKAFITGMDLLQHFPSLHCNSAGKIVAQPVAASLPSALSSDTFASLFSLCLQHLSRLWADRGIQLTYENRAQVRPPSAVRQRRLLPLAAAGAAGGGLAAV